MKPALTLASLALLAAPLSARAEEWRWGEVVREELFAPYFQEYPDADAVVLLDHGTARVDAKYRLRYRRHVRTKIMTDRGTDRAVVRIPFAEGQEIKNFRGQTIVPPGHLLKVEKQGIREEPEGTGHVMVVTFPSAQKGVVLEWEYELRSDDIHTIPEWRFQGQDPVRLSRFELQVPSGMTYDAEFPWTPGMIPTPAKTTINDPDNQQRQLAQAAWELRHQKPVPDLAYVPYPAEYGMALHVQIRDHASTMESFPVKRSWEEIGKTLDAEVAALLKDGSGVAEWAGLAAPAAGGDGAAAWARAAHARIRDGLATDPPKAGRAARPPAAVVADGHGTALEKNLVLLSLLRGGGLTADPVFVRTRPSGLFEPKRTDPAQLDHVLVRLAVAGSAVWLDAASYCPFGTLPPDARVTRGVLARAAGGSEVEVDAPRPESARTVTTSATLDRNGTLAAVSHVSLEGDRALAARRALAAEDPAAFAGRLVRARFGDAASVESVEVAASDPGQPIALDVKFRVPGFGRSQGERMSCGIPFLDAASSAPVPEEGRALPIELPFAGTSREDVTVELPAGYLLEAVPAGTTTKSADFRGKTTHAKGEGAFTSTREVSVREPRVDERDIPKLVAFLAEMRTADAAEVGLRETTMRSASR